MPLKKFTLILFCSILGTGLLISLWLWSYAVSPGGLQEAATAEGIVTIPAGADLQDIRSILARAGAVKDDVRFVLLARLLGASRRLQAGDYRFASGATPIEVLHQLEAGRIVRWPVTIPEGATLAEIADILARGHWVDPKRFLALAHDPHFIRSLGIQADSLEGYLFPETYDLTRGESAEEIIRTMVAQLREVMAGLCPGFSPTTPNTIPLACTEDSSPPLSLRQLLTLASIVEKETGQADERPLVACVFLNRLRKGMRLQSDPTVIYGLPHFNGDLTLRDLRSNSPYNTYRVKGLPPTPIANPGRAAIEAVLHPAHKPYLYFVSRNDGTHQFSITLAEQNRAVAKYQKGIKTVARKGR